MSNIYLAFYAPLPTTDVTIKYDLENFLYEKLRGPFIHVQLSYGPANERGEVMTASISSKTGKPVNEPWSYRGMEEFSFMRREATEEELHALAKEAQRFVWDGGASHSLTKKFLGVGSGLDSVGLVFAVLLKALGLPPSPSPPRTPSELLEWSVGVGFQACLNPSGGGGAGAYADVRYRGLMGKRLEARGKGVEERKEGTSRGRWLDFF